jgi:hypothetical protein
MSFRNTVGTTALTVVQGYLSHRTQEQTEEYVGSALSHHKEVPFLYRVFKPTLIPAKKEKGGYKVVSVFRPPRHTQHPHFRR